jgi:hypothetical protein
MSLARLAWPLGWSCSIEKRGAFQPRLLKTTVTKGVA